MGDCMKILNMCTKHGSLKSLVTSDPKNRMWHLLFFRSARKHDKTCKKISDASPKHIATIKKSEISQ